MAVRKANSARNCCSMHCLGLCLSAGGAKAEAKSEAPGPRPKEVKQNQGKFASALGQLQEPKKK